MKKIIMASLILFIEANAKVPEWAAHNSTKLNGPNLTTVCHGTGPSLDIARADALKSCQVSASQYFNSKINVKSLSVETEKSVGFHQEISNEDIIEGLICNPQRDEVEELDSQFKIWMECKFDLNKVSTTAVPKINEGPSNNASLSQLESSKIEPNADTTAKFIFVSTVPKCESVIVKGTTPRTVQCGKNPMRIEIKGSDSEILIRAAGYKPKTIQLKGVNANEILQVLLDLL